MNRSVLHSSPVQQIMAAGNPNWWCYTNGIIKAPEVIPSNYSSNFLPPFPSSPPCSSGWHSVHSEEELQQSWTQLLRDGLVSEEEEEEEEDQKSGNRSCEANRVKTWQEQVLWEQAQQEHVSPTMEYVKRQNSTNNYLYRHPDDQGAAAKMSEPTNNWSYLRSSPKSCIASYGTANKLSNISTFSKSNARHPPPNRSPECNSNAAGGAQKKARLQSSSTQSTFKVRKEKLGDRIAALHQLVSPFGKTDTASVLLEATGYIRFLHSQIEALSLPYFGKNSGDLNHKVYTRELTNDDSSVCGEEVEDLRSRGLCLVPMPCTVHQVGRENGADYWAQA